MRPETIKAIFTNLLFVIGVVLAIVGFVQGTRTVVKLLVFDKYPLDGYTETKCDQPIYPPEPVAMDKTQPPPATINNDQIKAKCEAELSIERKVRETEDIVGSISMLVSGIALIYFFRKYILH